MTWEWLNDDLGVTWAWLEDDSGVTWGLLKSDLIVTWEWLEGDMRLTLGWLQDDLRVTWGWLENEFRMPWVWLEGVLKVTWMRYVLGRKEVRIRMYMARSRKSCQRRLFREYFIMLIMKLSWYFAWFLSFKKVPSFSSSGSWSPSLEKVTFWPSAIPLSTTTAPSLPTLLPEKNRVNLFLSQSKDFFFTIKHYSLISRATVHSQKHIILII